MPRYLDVLYQEQYEPLALRSRRPNTKRLYRATLKFFDEFLGRRATIDDLNDATVSAFAAHRLDSDLSKYTVNRDLFNLLALWRWCHRKRIVRNWPDVELEKPPGRQRAAHRRGDDRGAQGNSPAGRESVSLAVCADFHLQPARQNHGAGRAAQ